MALRSFFKRVLPKDHEIREHKQLRFLGKILHDPNIFHITRRSLAGGAAIGLFVGCLPIPGHMVVASVFSILFRVNLPLAVLLVWVTNPLTFAPYLFLAYKTGAHILNVPTEPVNFQLSLSWASKTLHRIWEPLLVGCLCYSTGSSILGYFSVRLAWRIATIRKWKKRKRLQAQKSD